MLAVLSCYGKLLDIDQLRNKFEMTVFIRIYPLMLSEELSEHAQSCVTYDAC